MLDTYIFDFPGFYSLVVPLFPAPDFFFSGHVGTLLLCTLYLKDYVNKKWVYVGVVFIIIEAFIITALRAHYSIDIIFGLLISHYIYTVLDPLAKFVDKKWGLFGKQEKKTNQNEQTIQLNLTL
jgi:hypothetical protein